MSNMSSTQLSIGKGIILFTFQQRSDQHRNIIFVLKTHILISHFAFIIMSMFAFYLSFRLCQMATPCPHPLPKQLGSMDSQNISSCPICLYRLLQTYSAELYLCSQYSVDQTVQCSSNSEVLFIQCSTYHTM